MNTYAEKKIKVLLVNPYIYDFSAFDLWLRPLGLLYIAAVLEKYSNAELHWLDTLNRPPKGPNDSGRGKYHREKLQKPPIYADIPRYYSRYGIPFDSFKEKLEQLPEMDLIFVTSLMTYWIDGVTVTIHELRKRFPRAKIVLGGIIPSLVPPAELRHQVEADLFVSGYGEHRALEIVKEMGATVYPHPDLTDPRNLPYPAYGFLKNRNALPLMTSRGCPFHCTYCASDKLNPGFLERRAEDVEAEIRHMHHTFGTRHFAVFDDALLINKHKRFLKIFRSIGRDLQLSFHTPNGVHAREMDRETTQLMYDCGFKTIRLSFESTHEDILKRSANKVNVRQMVTAVENLVAAGYKPEDLGVYLLMGLPGQKVGDVHAALDFVAQLDLTPSLSYYSPVPQTEDFIHLQKAGILSTPIDLLQTNKLYFLYNKSGFSAQDIRELKQRTIRNSE